MDIFGWLEDCKGDDPTNLRGQDNKATKVQLVISLALGLSSFISFCVSSVHTQLSYLVLIFARYCDRDGSHSMRPESSRPMLPRACQSYRIHSLDGFWCSIKLLSRRFLRLLAWMLLLYVIKVRLYLKYLLTPKVSIIFQNVD